jgi:hypothetical protein
MWFAPMNRFSVKDRDTRDPHFLVFHDRLFFYTGTWYSGPGTLPLEDYDLNKHLGFVELSSKRALVSYYSSHERDASGKMITAIYLAELTLNP